MTDTNNPNRTQPLFEEPSLAMERDDPWSGPKGFVLGGMALPCKEKLAEEYFRAADLLVELIQNDRCEDYKLVNPVLYLYRHSLELLLKAGLTNEVTGHSLATLADKLKIQIADQPDLADHDWIFCRISEISKHDPGSTAFRYAENKDKSTKKSVPVDGEIYISLNHLKESMRELFSELARLLKINWEDILDE